jgi:aspartyl-tRNA(Asn)/glutamyl-tRNA(Gln) amidotransferase subunit B
LSWEAVIGLEIHVQLATRSKIFSGASTAYGASPNAQACNIDLGLPGVLPVLNEQSICTPFSTEKTTFTQIYPRGIR